MPQNTPDCELTKLTSSVTKKMDDRRTVSVPIRLDSKWDDGRTLTSDPTRLK